MIVALYARVSTAKQAERDLSIPDQLRQMRDWCKREGHTVAVEYVEPGASATDGRRPVFQRMMSDACQSPAPFEAIIVHSLSRFFRDSIEFGWHERELNRAGIKLVSITQRTDDSLSGELVRKVISVFDEFQSKENAKHTLRAMQENARQGYFNGSTPPFGYKLEEVAGRGNKGNKKRLTVDPAESAIVRKIFSGYLSGQGMKAIAAQFNQQGITRRGSQWSRGRIADTLSDPVYNGEYYFNKKCGKTQKPKPRSEWIRIDVEPILNPGIFHRVEQLRDSRSPKNTPPRNVNSSTLLVGMLRCGCCGAGMTLATGKGGRYRYYKCTNRINKSVDACESRNVPMEKLDRAVIAALIDQVLAPERVTAMLARLQKKLRGSGQSRDEELDRLRQELAQVDTAVERLYEAVEKGVLDLDDTLAQRSKKLQARRQSVLLEMAGLRREKQMPTIKVGPKAIAAFSRSLREKLLEPGSKFAREYLKVLVGEISLQGNQVHITGSSTANAK